MMKKNHYFGICLVLLFGFCHHLAAGQIKLEKQVSLDNLGILKPSLIKVHLGNIYIFDNAEMSFFIINNEFKVIKKFGKSGLGPEEYRKPVEFGFFNNRLWVTDSYGKMLRYDLDGKFIEEKKQPTEMSLIMEQIDADRYFVFNNQVDENRNITKSLVFITSTEKINLIKVKESMQLTSDFENKINFLFAATINSAYVVPSDKQYYIRRFDINKNAFIGEIEKKDVRRIKYNEKETAQFNERMKKLKASTPGFQLLNINPPVLKPAIKQIYADERDRVYIICPTSQEGKYSLDLYDKALKYQDNFIIPVTGLFFPTSDFIYLIIIDDEEETYWLQVYSLIP